MVHFRRNITLPLNLNFDDLWWPQYWPERKKWPKYFRMYSLRAIKRSLARVYPSWFWVRRCGHLPPPPPSPSPRGRRWLIPPEHALTYQGHDWSDPWLHVWHQSVLGCLCFTVCLNRITDHFKLNWYHFNWYILPLPRQLSNKPAIRKTKQKGASVNQDAGKIETDMYVRWRVANSTRQNNAGAGPRVTGPGTIAHALHHRECWARAQRDKAAGFWGKKHVTHQFHPSSAGSDLTLFLAGEGASETHPLMFSCVIAKWLEIGIWNFLTFEGLSLPTFCEIFKTRSGQVSSLSFKNLQPSHGYSSLG